MSNLPTNDIFSMWLDENHRTLSGQQAEKIRTFYSFARKPDCKTATQLNKFIHKLTGDDDQGRREIVRIFREFLNEIKESQTFKRKTQ